MAADGEGYLIGIPTQLGYGGDDQYVDCRVLVDTNRDGIIDDRDSCVPTGGFINALRPINLAMPLIEAASQGRVTIHNETAPVGGAPGSAPRGRYCIADDFSDTTTGWDWTGSDSNIRYAAAGLNSRSDQPRSLTWSTTIGYLFDLNR